MPAQLNTVRNATATSDRGRAGADATSIEQPGNRRRHERAARRIAFGLAIALFAWPGLIAPASADDTATPSSPPSSEKPASAEPTTESLRGKVVWQADALRRRFGIESDREAEQSVAALEADDGSIYPLVRDARGRGFWLDGRLRDRELELFVRRYPGSPVVQVIRVYTLRPEGKYELDYWCDICAIPMYELKDCECCQGVTRLRERRVPPGAEVGTDGDEPTDAQPAAAAADQETTEKAAEPLQ